MAHNVFISFAGNDAAVGRALCATLEKLGLDCWLAPRNIEPGVGWTDAIMDGISSSRLMVVIWSRHAKASPYVTLEVKHAWARGIPIILFRTEEVDLPKDLHFFLAFIQWFDALTPNLERHYENLAGVIKKRLTAAAESYTEDSSPAPNLKPSFSGAKKHVASILSCVVAVSALCIALYKPGSPISVIDVSAKSRVAPERGAEIQAEEQPILGDNGKLQAKIKGNKIVAFNLDAKNVSTEIEHVEKIIKAEFFKNKGRWYLKITDSKDDTQMWDALTWKLKTF